MSSGYGPERIRPLPQKGAWYPASSSNGGAHWGKLYESGTVQARCGLVFTPTTDPERGGPLWWYSPVDPEHACSECRGDRT